MKLSTTQIAEKLKESSPEQVIVLFKVRLLTDVNTTKPGGKRHYHAADQREVAHLAKVWTPGKLTERKVRTLRLMLEDLVQGKRPAPPPMVQPELTLVSPSPLAGPSTTSNRALDRIEAKVDRLLTFFDRPAVRA